MIYLLVSVHLYVHPSALYPIDNLSICSQSFFKYCIHIVIRDEWYGIVNGQKLSIFNRVTALFHTGKIVSGIFSSPLQSPGRAIVLPLASALTLA